jgi:hypothetical protein
MEATPKSASSPGSAGGVPANVLADVVAKGDYDLFAQALADDVVFRSPVSRFRFQGKDITSALFERLVKQSDPDQWQVHGAWNLGEGRHLVALTTTVRGHKLDLLLLVRLNERLQVCEVTAYGRPMAAIGIFPAFVFPHLATLFRSPARGRLLRTLFRPLPRALELFLKKGLGFGQPPQAEFEEKLPEPEQIPAALRSAEQPTDGARPPAEPAGPRSPFRRV